MAPGTKSMNEVKYKKEVSELLDSAPEVFTSAIRSWLFSEKNKFVGGGRSKKEGDFEKELGQKKRKYRSGNWSKYIARAFGGEVESGDDLGNMLLHMHPKSDRKEKLPYLESLAKGATVTPKNAKWLIIPNYKNLLTVGLFGRVGGNGKNTFQKLFKQLYNTSQLQMVPYHGRLLYFADTPDVGGSHGKRHMHQLNRKLLFTGVKQTQYGKQFDFEQSWNNRISDVVARGNKTIERTVSQIERGIKKV